MKQDKLIVASYSLLIASPFVAIAVYAIGTWWCGKQASIYKCFIFNPYIPLMVCAALIVLSIALGVIHIILEGRNRGN